MQDEIMCKYKPVFLDKQAIVIFMLHSVDFK